MSIASKSIEISKVLAQGGSAGQKAEAIADLHQACRDDTEKTAFVLALAAELITAQARLALANRQGDAVEGARN